MEKGRLEDELGDNVGRVIEIALFHGKTIAKYNNVDDIFAWKRPSLVVAFAVVLFRPSKSRQFM